MMKLRKKIMLGVFGAILGIIWLAPFYLIIANSFKTKKEMFSNLLGFPASFNLDNYVTAAKSLTLQVTFINSLLVSVISVCFIIAFAALSAYALERTRTKASTIIFYLFVIAMLIPFQTIMIPLVSLGSKLNLLNRVGLIYMYLGFGASQAIFLYHGSIKSIPRSLDEAAKIDGCTPLQTFVRIILPMLKPITVTVAILDIIWIWNDYLLPSLVINKKGLETIPLKMFYFFGEYTKQWHLALAGLVLAIVPVIVFYFLMQKQIIEGMTQGAVK